jgi:hypothetical protein
VIGLWGCYDVDDFDELIVGRVTRHAIAERLPSATIRPFSPLGYVHPVSLDSSDPASALGRWTPDRLADLSAELECVVIAGSNIVQFDDGRLVDQYRIPVEEAAEIHPSRFFVEGLGPELERETPVAWSALRVATDPTPDEGARLRSSLETRAYVTVGDALTLARLEACGVERAIDVVPDPALLASETVSHTLLEKRLAYLRAIDAYPASSAVIMIEETPRLGPHVKLIAAAAAELAEQMESVPELLLVNLDGDRAEQLLAALRAATGLPVRRLPREVVLEDLLAVIASADGFVGVSSTAAAVAQGFARPYAVLVEGTETQDVPAGGGIVRTIGAGSRGAADLVAALREPPSPEQLATARTEIGIHFDRIAALAVGAAERRSGTLIRPVEQGLDRRWQLLERAHARRGQQMIAERLAFADRSRDFVAQIEVYQQHVDQLAKMVRDFDHQVSQAESEVRAVHATRTFRVLAPLRRVYGRLRQR